MKNRESFPRNNNNLNKVGLDSKLTKSSLPIKLKTINNNMNYLKNITLTLLVIFGLSFSIDSIAQAPPPPPPSHGSTGNQNGGNAPIGGGLFILLGLGAAYGGKKLYEMRKENLEE